MKYIQVLLIVFCLGIFLIPKDNFYAQASQENCCKTGDKEDSCCEKDHSKHDEKDGESSCKDDCCSYCMTCHTFVENISSKTVVFNYSPFKTEKKLDFPYSNPYISNSLKDIWQPPKLG